MQHMYLRVLELDDLLKRKSVFLFGPRQTGKTTWLKGTYSDALYINLLSTSVFNDYLTKNGALESDIALHLRKQRASHLVIIDEVQKLPSLLNDVHDQIEKNKSLRFILTGSSARKLKREGANLLGGRASWRHFLPLVYPEIKSQLQTHADLERRLTIGALPSIYDSSAPQDDLLDYAQLYLNEEIKAEGLVRNYEAFHRFLLTAALVNAKQLNFTQVGNDAQVPPRTIQDYFQILEDTLVGFLLPAFTETPSRKATTTAKFYFFDTGVVNVLLDRSKISSGTSDFGDLFEHFVVSEVRAYQQYRSPRSKLFYWRSLSKQEVDLVIKTKEKMIALEIKAKQNVSEKEYRAIHAFAEDYPQAKKLVVTLASRPFIDSNGVEILPIFEFLERLWADEVF